MSRLILSRNDLDFLLFDWLHVQDLTARTRFSEHTRDTFRAALDVYESIAGEQFAPHNKKNDEHEPQFDGIRAQVNPEVGAALEVFCDSGLMAAAQDFELGGMQLPYVVERAGVAFLLAANAGTMGYPFLTMANANLLLHHGSPEQIKRFVNPMLEGSFFGTMCLSESNAGSSLADIKTRAQLQPDGRYRLYGNKMWISGGDHELSQNIVHLVLAKVADEKSKVSPGIGGISLFIVPKYVVHDGGLSGERNDVVLAGLNHKMGYRGTVNCLLNFGEGRFKPEGEAGALGELVGERGKGLSYMFHMMNEARIGVGLGAAAIGYTGYLHALDYAKERRQGKVSGEPDPGKPPARLIEHADVRRMLLAQKAYVEGGLALTLFSARLVDDAATAEDKGQRESARQLLELLTPVTKSWPSQWCLAANDLAIQVHGGYGYSREYKVEQFYRDNRLNAIHEGTHGIQALDLLGRKVAAGEGAAMRLLGERLKTTVAQAGKTTTLKCHATKLDEAWRLLFSVTENLLALSDERLRLANATAYLEAFGHIVVAWLWLDKACSALQLRTERDDFRRGKLAACTYFYTWELPKVPAWLAVLDPIERTPLDLDEPAF